MTTPKDKVQDPTAEPRNIAIRRLYEQLGNLSVTFNVLEVVVSARVWELIGPDQGVGRTVTERLTFGPLVDLLRDLYPHRYPDPNQGELMKSLHHDLQKANELRNTLLHTMWSVIANDPLRGSRFKLRFKGRGGLTQHDLSSEIAEIESAIKTIIGLYERVMKLTDKVIAIGDPDPKQKPPLGGHT